VEVTGIDLSEEASIGGTEANTTSPNEIILSYLADLPPEAQTVIVLCGIPGCGKSTFARRLINTMPSHIRRRWVTANQDDLKTRKAVENRVISALSMQQSVIVDRCNFDVEQRAHWIRLAEEYNVFNMIVVVMPGFDNLNVCIRRAYDRGDSDGVHCLDTDWRRVCRRMKSDFVMPSYDEGFCGIYIGQNDADMDQLIQVISHQSS
jgi:adenylate kinase family enzyme